jgi:hypothetical protein
MPRGASRKRLETVGRTIQGDSLSCLAEHGSVFATDLAFVARALGSDLGSRRLIILGDLMTYQV